MKKSNWLLICGFAFCILNFYGCATAPIENLPQIPHQMPGIYHRVKRGQTLWRISKIYNVDIAEIINANRIPDTSRIETGQTIFIPGQQNTQPRAIALNEEDFCWPLKGKVIADYGQMAGNTINRGIDILAGANSNVVASRSGKVVFYSPAFEGLGKTIIIEHAGGYSTLYARNSEVFITPGQEISKGMIIARVGSAGRDKAKYLHFELRKGYLPQNPSFYLP